MHGTKLLTLLSAALILGACSTTGHFKIPDNSELYINKRTEKVAVQSNGDVTVSPFFWSSAGGVPYKLMKDGSTVKEGKLRAKFRVVSIFWPPYAFIYWPMGLNPSITYDLIQDKQE